MTKFSTPIITAVALFPLIALLITVPFMVLKYRRIGSVPFLHALVVYSFVFYLMCAYFLVLLPLPADRSASVGYAITPQLVPFAFIRGFLASGTFSADDPSTWITIVTNPYMYEAFFNVLLLAPLGAYLRYYFRRRWWQVLIIGFLVSLSFETTQLTGIWGIYEHPYRLFDVDDLMTNTLGAMVGFWACGPLMRALPDPRIVARQAKRRGRFASATRRALAFTLDLALSQVIAVALFSIGRIAAAGVISTGAPFGITHAKFWISEIIGIGTVFILFALITRGQTPAQKLLKLAIVTPRATGARGWQVIVRYATLFMLILLPIWAFGLIAGARDLPTTPGEMQALAASALGGSGALAALWCVGMATWAASLGVRAWRARYREEEFLMLNGIVSGTRIMTLDGIEAARAERRVLDVADVVKLEQAIATAGTPLDELMRRAGASVAQEIMAWVPEPAPVVVLCGGGNNGGDGWVCAHLLAREGWPVTVVTPRAANELEAWPARDEAQATCTAIEREGLPIKQLIRPSDTALAAELDGSAAIVDALLGTGFSGNVVKQPLAGWIELANARRRAGGKAKSTPFALAVDAPSGLSAQTGNAAQPCFLADETLTMLALKPGLLQASAKPYTGSVELAELVSADEMPEGAKALEA